LHLLNADEDAL